jgi:hypothetical protein
VTSISVASGRQLFVDSVNKLEFNSNFVLLFSHVLGKVRRHSEKYQHANEINNTKCPLDNKRAYAHLILCALGVCLNLCYAEKLVRVLSYGIVYWPAIS